MAAVDAALLIAIISVGVAAGGLLWQLIFYHLSGSRLEVRLSPVLVDERSVIKEGPESGWKKGPPPFPEAIGPWVIDLAHVRVTNVGRTPVSVSDVSLDFGRYRWFRHRSRIRMSNVPVSVLKGREETAVRLDAGESTSNYFDIWPLIEEARKWKHGVLTVRASAQPAARRPKRSRWRRRWRIPPDAKTLRTPDDAAPANELRAFHAVWRQLRIDPDAFALLEVIWRVIQPNLSTAATSADLTDELERQPFPDDRYHALVSFAAFQAYHGQGE